MAENNGDKPGQQFMTVEVPEYAITINPDEEGNPVWIGLDIKTSGTHFEVFLCRPEPAEIEKVARLFTRELNRAANTIKRQKRTLIVAEGVDSRVLRAPQEGR